VKGQIVNHSTVLSLAEKYQKTPAQVVLRWDFQHEVVTIPKSANPDRIAENAQVFDFELSAGDMAVLDALDEGRRVGPDPNNFKF
jgi:diketogulonate reductase-like aldo/keto reductase